MENKTILRISFIISITGILFLLFLATSLKAKTIKASEIDKKLINKKIQIYGAIINIKNYSTLQLIKIRDESGTVDIVLYEKISLKKNQKISVKGKITEYKGQLQVQADRIEII